MPERDNQRILTAGDLQRASDLSYRQVNDWDAKGALPGDRAGNRDWRRFTAREVFTVAVLSELRKAFGVPLEKLTVVRKYMLQPGADHFRAAAELMALLGIGVYLLTDFDETFVIDSELEFSDMMDLGYFGGDKPVALVLLKLNPIVNRVLTCLKEPTTLTAHGYGYKLAARMRQSMGAAHSKEEARLLGLLRTGRFDRVEIRMENGELKTARGTTYEKTTDLDEITRLIEEHDYQQVTVIREGGEIRGIRRTRIEKLGD